MAYITGKIPQGNCGAVVYENGRYRCSPVPDQPGKDPRAVKLLDLAIMESSIGPHTKLALVIESILSDMCWNGMSRYLQIFGSRAITSITSSGKAAG